MRDRAWALLDQLAVSGGNFLSIALCAHVLSVTEQGKWMYSYIYYLLLLVMNISLVFQAAQVLMPRSAEREVYRARLFALQLGLAVIGIMIILLLSTVFASLIDDRRSLSELLALISFLFVQQLSDYVRRMEHICGGTRVAALGSIVSYGSRLLAVAIVQPHMSSTVLWIFAAAALLPLLVHLKYNLRHYLHNLPSRILKDNIEHLSFSRNFLAAASFSWAWSFVPIFVLGAVKGAASVAVLSSIRSLTNVANVVMEYIDVSVIAPLARRVMQEGSGVMWSLLRRILFGGLAVFVLGTVIILGYGDAILKLIFGAKYNEYGSILVIVWVSYAIYFIGRLQAIGYRIGLNTRIELMGSMSSAFAALVCAYPMIVWLGVEGAALSYLIVALSGLLAQLGYAYYLKNYVEQSVG